MCVRGARYPEDWERAPWSLPSLAEDGKQKVVCLGKLLLLWLLCLVGGLFGRRVRGPAAAVNDQLTIN
jgi:hypothetical protein